MTRSCYLSTAALYRLELACRPLWKLARTDGCNGGVYLVGSASERPDFRDVDVRMILPDHFFDARFADAAMWSTFCYAVSRWLSADTELPVDFQVQRMTEANVKYGDQPRNPVGHGHRDFAGLGDATPYDVHASKDGGR